MDAYVYQATIFCKSCAEAIADKLPTRWSDSDDYPKGPYSNGGGEADRPQHCDACELFLENPLTEDGIDYVRRELSERETIADDSALAQWRDFYKQDLPLAKETDEILEEVKLEEAKPDTIRN